MRFNYAFNPTTGEYFFSNTFTSATVVEEEIAAINSRLREGQGAFIATFIDLLPSQWSVMKAKIDNNNNLLQMASLQRTEWEPKVKVVRGGDSWARQERPKVLKVLSTEDKQQLAQELVQQEEALQKTHQYLEDNGYTIETSPYKGLKEEIAIAEGRIAYIKAQLGEVQEKKEEKVQETTVASKSVESQLDAAAAKLAAVRGKK